MTVRFPAAPEWNSLGVAAEKPFAEPDLTVAAGFPAPPYSCIGSLSKLLFFAMPAGYEELEKSELDVGFYRTEAKASVDLRSILAFTDCNSALLSRSKLRSLLFRPIFRFFESYSL